MKNTKRELILAYGEVKGHAHRLQGELDVLVDTPDVKAFSVGSGGAKLTHEEHDLIGFKQGNYTSVIQKQYNPYTRMSENVLD